MMYSNVIFLSRIEALNLTPRADTVMISLILPETPVIFEPGYHAVLQLTMHDIAEERVRLPLGSISDENPLPHKYKGEQYIWPDLHHAPREVYEEGLLEHPAIPGLMLNLDERLYWAALEIVNESTGETRSEAIREKIFRVEWRKPIPKTITRTGKDFLR